MFKLSHGHKLYSCVTYSIYNLSSEILNTCFLHTIFKYNLKNLC